MKAQLAVAIALLALASTALTADSPKKSPSTRPAATFVSAEEITWGEAPPVFPKGAQMAVLFGNPSKKGPYAIRFKMPDGYKIAPHWHTQDEQLTVLTGTFVLHLGDTMDVPGHTLGPSAYHFLPARMHHAAESTGETILQINGNGPFDIHYLDPADDPSKKASAKP